ncbi:hypothetical protein, partial [Escherichia coli]
MLSMMTEILLKQAMVG